MAPSLSADHNSTVIAVAENLSPRSSAQDAERQRPGGPCPGGEGEASREWLRQHAPTPYQTTHHIPIWFSQCSFEHRAAVAAAGRRS
jgi:hypothetical protein